jgi:hypothetical protein
MRPGGIVAVTESVNVSSFFQTREKAVVTEAESVLKKEASTFVDTVKLVYVPIFWVPVRVRTMGSFVLFDIAADIAIGVP